MLRRPILNLCVALWLLALLNVPFWRRLWETVGGWDTARAGFLLSLPVFVLACVWLTIECITWGRSARPVLAALLFLSATVAYFMHTYGVVFDRGMVANLVETDLAEALGLFSPVLIVWLLLLAAVPVWVLAQVYIAPQSWTAQLLGKAMTFGVLVSAMALIIAPSFQSYVALLRNHRDLRLLLVPSNYLGALHSYAKTRLASRGELGRVGADASRAAPAGRKPSLTVIVVGETARAANFGLNGYARATTPGLAATPGIINFSQVRSCGTSTAVSLPCMFLDTGRAGFSDSLALRRENLLDVLQRAGVGILWRDNNSGCKGVCARVPHEDLTAAEFCPKGGCHDEILLDGLQTKIDAMAQDALIVLHMKGSHGPAYYLRYPAAFEHFVPTCKTNQFDKCERQSIVNAYDNTLRYTDHVLTRTIELLQANAERFDPSLIYVSDHGESLGERGLYLHGLPYALAPQEQTHVPMLVWMPEASRQRLELDLDCMRGKQDEMLSHDYLYHSVLGLLGVQVGIYRRGLDVFQSCREGGSEWLEASGRQSGLR